MRKLILTAAILASGFSVNAISNEVLPTHPITISVVEDFTEITLDKLPKVVVDAVSKDFEGASLVKAYVNSSEQYKLELKVKEVITPVFIDKDGNWLEETDIQFSESK